jgi:hypothetical protein
MNARRFITAIFTLCVAALAFLAAAVPGALGVGAHPAALNPRFPQDDAAVGSNVGVWSTDCIDCPPFFVDMSDRSLRVDSADHLHIAYGSDHLYYAWHDGGEWHRQTVDDGPDVGASASLALDASDHPHIAYWDRAHSRLKYAVFDGDVWHVEVVPTGADSEVAGHTSIAVDPSRGRPHITYHDASDDVLKYAWHDGDEWHVETVDPDGGAYTSLALDDTGTPHVSYQGWESAALKYARREGASWHVDTLDKAGGSHTSLALDGDGTPHISYHGDWSLKYARLAGTGWLFQTVDGGASGFVGQDTALAIDASGRPHIAYLDMSNAQVKYAWLDAESWHFADVGRADTEGAHTSLALDSLGQPHISYVDEEVKALVHASRHSSGGFAPLGDGGWEKQPVDYLGWAYSFRDSLALDAQGHPHVAYGDSVERSIKYRWFDGATWHEETVVGSWSAVDPPSFALDASDRPHLAYFDNSTKNMMYAWRDGATWHSEIAIEDSHGSKPALALDPEGQPHIAYSTKLRRPDTFLVYASRAQPPTASGSDGATWQVVTVPTLSDPGVGDDVSLVMDASGRPHIAYTDLTNGLHLEYAWHDGATWRVETVLTGSIGPTGLGNALALDGAGRPHIAYYESTLHSLKYSWHDGTVWWAEVADAESQVEGQTSIALDASGAAHITYYDGDAAALKYARRIGANWYTETVPVGDGGDVGRLSSLDLGSAGRPHVVYSDVTIGDVRYARVTPLLVEKRAEPREGVEPGATVTYTLKMSGPGLSVRLLDPLPDLVEYVPGSISSAGAPGAVYSPTLRAITWQGELSESTATIRFQVKLVELEPGSGVPPPVVVNTVWVFEDLTGARAEASASFNGWSIYLPVVSRGH